jgi:hypothetical protein
VIFDVLSSKSARRHELKHLFYILLLFTLIFCVSATSWCDENANVSQPTASDCDEKSDQDFEKISQQMTPMFGNMVESMMQGKLKVFAQKETTTLLAKFVRNFYDSLIEEGFSKKEALNIVTSFGFPATQ